MKELKSTVLKVLDFLEYEYLETNIPETESTAIAIPSLVIISINEKNRLINLCFNILILPDISSNFTLELLQNMEDVEKLGVTINGLFFLDYETKEILFDKEATDRLKKNIYKNNNVNELKPEGETLH